MTSSRVHAESAWTRNSLGDSSWWSRNQVENWAWWRKPNALHDPSFEAYLGDLLGDFHAYISRGIEPGISVRNNLETMAACELMVCSITGRRCVARGELA